MNSIADSPTAKASDTLAKLQPVKAASDDQAAPQPSPGSAAIAGAKAREPLDPAGLQSSATVRPGADSAYSPASTKSLAAGSIAPAAPMPNASLQPLELASRNPIFGTPHRVSTVSIKADGSIASDHKTKANAPTPAASVAVSAADPASANASSANVSSTAASVAPSVKRRFSTERAKPTPAVAADAPQSKKTPKPLTSSATAESDQQPQPSAPPPAPAPIAAVASVLRAVFQGSHAPSAQPEVTTADARTNAAAVDSVSLKLASSLSERDARATLLRLQQHFPGMLADASVRREDTGSRDVLYRVGVGPLSREAADKICSQLKAGGARCAMSSR
ncbi:Sporulation related domain-containing protein [Rhizobiales bacterium GAS188]|nr:Sporulation related domain-containing protein [Rhizobiales bacterium GAS188]